MNINQQEYEEEYFKDYFGVNLNNIGPSNIKKIKNWYWAWFKYIDKFENITNGNNRKVLEIGSAIGGFAALLKEHGFDVFASDISRYAINHARKLWADIKYYNFDIHQGIPINERFNLIFAFEVLEHLQDPLIAITNMRAKLASGGMIVCSSPPPYNKYRCIKGHINVKAKQNWNKLFQAAGFRAENIIIKQIVFLPYLYKFSRKFSLVIPLGINLPYFNSTYLIFARI